MSSVLPLILIILDGWGISDAEKGNAIANASTPFFDYLYKNYPSTKIFAHGKHVGLPAGQDGNSEAGHLNLGAGRVVEQESVRINNAIKDGTFFRNQSFLNAIKHARSNKSNLHLLGLVSGVMSPHSMPGHLKALIEFLEREKFSNYYLHLFTDGRDSYQRGALKFIGEIERDLLGGKRKIGTIMGRYYGMDRKKNWSATKRAYNALVIGDDCEANSPQAAITESYNKNVTDEFIEPYIIKSRGKQLPRISDNDSVIFFNLRSDRARQITKCFTQSNFNRVNPQSFTRKKKVRNLKFVALTDFGPDLDNIETAFPGALIENALPKVLDKYSQLYVAETEKYAHVTYFFNGGYSNPVNGEKWKVIPSPNCKHYDDMPEMNSKELTKIVINNLRHRNFKLTRKRGDERIWHNDFTVLNFAAPDMIGHTGNYEAGITCCEGIDNHIKNITKAYLNMGGTVIITADHGNIEEMVNLKTGEIDTKHSVSMVPFILVNTELKRTKLREGGRLSDVAPTIIDLIGSSKPKEMKGRSLVEKVR